MISLTMPCKLAQTANSTRSTGSCNFVVLEKFTKLHSKSCCYLYKIFYQNLHFIMSTANSHKFESYKWTLNILISVWIFSILFPIQCTFPKVLTRRICLTIKSFFFNDHFLYSHDLNVWFRGDTVKRNTMLVILRAQRVRADQKWKRKKFKIKSIFPVTF